MRAGVVGIVTAREGDTFWVESRNLQGLVVNVRRSELERVR